MKIHSVFTFTAKRTALFAALLLALPILATAQTGSASSNSLAGMDMGSMAGMSMPTKVASQSKVAKPKKHRAAKPVSSSKPMKSAMPMQDMAGMDMGSMHSMNQTPSSEATPMPSMDGMKMDHGAMQGMSPHDMAGMDMGSMPAMNQTPSSEAAPMPSMAGMKMDHGAMQGMSPHDMPNMDHESMPTMNHNTMQNMPSMGMEPMQGGSAPANARSPDYSDGVGYGSMTGMDMEDNALIGMLLIDQLEFSHGKDGNGQTWEAQGWYGNDTDKLWIRTEGDRSRSKTTDGDIEAFWNRNITTFWSTQLGVRHDLGEGNKRNWAAFGVQGISPYWFDLEATGYADKTGRTAARLRAEYELLFTQKLILQPEFEANLYGKSDPAARLGSGLSDTQLGLRLRYEVKREFAPYIGIVWSRRFGETASFARDDHQAIFDQQLVAGIHFWF